MLGKKTFEKREENNKMSGYAQLCGSFFMHGSLFMLATRHVLPNLCQNDFKWEWLVCFANLGYKEHSDPGAVNRENNL